ncbi:MAG: hypothetical protein ACFFCI_24100 [Promethearchaeota archaeon]
MIDDDICDQDFKNCPYRIWDLTKNYPLCDYYRLYSRIIINQEFSQLSSLIRKACGRIRKEEARLDFIREIANKQGLDVLKNAQIGDNVFCQFGPYREVKLLEKPKDGSIFVKCEAPNGKIIEVQACDLRRISKGHYFSEFFVEGHKNGKKIHEIEDKVKSYGFRVETEKKDNGYLLKIYGDSQQEVDDFIALALEQNFDISSYI